jgi:putative FmdB family regulatory protein
MPNFTYKCKKCSNVFDYLLMDKDETVTCKKCGDKDVEKIITGCNVGGSKSSSGSHAGGGCACCPHKNG